MNRPSYKELWSDEYKDRDEQLQWIRNAVNGNAKFRNSEPPYSEEEELARKIMQMHARIAELEAEVTKCHELQDSYCDRIAELEADKERLNSCESALISMVNQFFYSKAGENIFRHSFMSAEEEAAEYLVEHGIARWVGKNKSAICFNEVQE